MAYRHELGELNNTNNSVSDLTEKNPKNTQLVEHIAIDETPFTVVREGEKWFVVMGQYRLSEAFVNKDVAIRDACGITWNRIIQVLSVALENFNNLNLEKDDNK